MIIVKGHSMLLRALSTTLLWLFTCSIAHAQGIETTRRHVSAIRFQAPPTVDGDLSDSCWQQAARADNFTDVLSGAPVDDQTVAYIGYDDRNIYLAFHCYDRQPQDIVARETKRGVSFQGEDTVTFSIDTFDTHRANDRSTFTVNPLGTQYAQLSGGRGTKLEWEGAWRAAARIVPDGWTAEMAIPWSILNYPAVRGETTCAVNFDRFQQHTNLHSWWSNIGGQRFYEYDGRWVGVQFPAFRPRLSLLPYVVPQWQPNGGAGVRFGLDLRGALSPTLTLVGTLNPDFEDVEQAVESIDFSYGAKFVPDRRPFFLEGSSIYSLGGEAGQYLYSPSIGNFDAGTNLYGKITPADTIGVLTALGYGRQADWVLRERHVLGATASLDAEILNHTDALGSNSVLVLSENFRRGFWHADAGWAGARSSRQGHGSTANASLYYEDARWAVELDPYYVDPNFKDDLGLIPFTGYRGASADINYATEYHQGWLRNLSGFLSTRSDQHYDGSLFRQQQSASLSIQTFRDYACTVGWNGGRFETFRDSVFNISMTARASDPYHTFGMGYSRGRQAGARYVFLAPFATWRFGNRLTIGLHSEILRHTDNLDQHILTINYDFSPRVGISGRLVSQTGGTGGYVAFRQSGYGGVETFLILGDPNAVKFTPRVAVKVIWAL